MSGDGPNRVLLARLNPVSPSWETLGVLQKAQNEKEKHGTGKVQAVQKPNGGSGTGTKPKPEKDGMEKFFDDLMHNPVFLIIAGLLIVLGPIAYIIFRISRGADDAEIVFLATGGRMHYDGEYKVAQPI
eukprot:CAMPEP_0181316920 /NCGR_PEP_ID=MMETSP1101-20121128/16151_1 /TAXON_ID=46948 /ORGANISM="Rhodomonas abbreviata, Strain Caron Lab Isolate" /LENGTH=128 /DNA_ID=CAMNT_0023424197 /DNA_START=381 /DNA_END=767 /DNA_ORIENTATION=+